MIRSRMSAGLSVLALLFSVAPAFGQEDADGAAPTFQEGDVITFEKIDALRRYIPDEFWNNRDFFFYEGMQLEIGPFFRDYSPADAFKAATKKYAGTARIGPDGSLENFAAGQPFPMESIDCLGDPQAGAKIMWNFDYAWNGSGGQVSFYYSYWDRGEELPLYYEGTAKVVLLSARLSL